MNTKSNLEALALILNIFGNLLMWLDDRYVCYILSNYKDSMTLFLYVYDFIYVLGWG